MLAGLLSLGGGATASASESGATGHPTGCLAEKPAGNWGAVVRCTNANGGSYRAVANCRSVDTGREAQFYGDWRQDGFSYAYCQGSYQAYSAGFVSSPRNNT
ncbi:hypothetical protein Snoj_05850 [Streptomyces nojiriensis]|uniref:Uncharacterized protein n=1 Tax=Streptomyces nojiriensis TaxID=66374 RepID=A0ABQ3SF18_9ACTN|nr:hypothetical protein GCM10010205_33210 [Streptomyces nojiriensis]GHI66667.1 hypothetical protein Snoj_05850 [Streptomyces nojiriensis]